MKKLCLNGIYFFFLLFFYSFNIQAKELAKSSANSFYLTWEGGYGQRETAPLGNGTKSFEPGMNVGVAVGYLINPALSAEVEFDSQVSALGTITDTLPGDLTAEEMSYEFMLNAYLHPWNWHKITPYIGGGLGLGVALPSIHINRSPSPSMIHVRVTDKNFAYQLMAGFRYALTNDLNVGLEYRYFRMPTLNYPDRKSSLTVNSGLVKITYLFNQTAKGNKNSQAKIIHGVYLATEGGVSIREKEVFGGVGDTKLFHTGPFMGLAFGDVLNQYFKAEAEISFRQNEVKAVQLQPGSGEAPSGDEETVAAMLNAYLTPFTIHLFAPYIGIGAGYAYSTYPLHVNLPPNLLSVQPTFPTFSHPRSHDSDFAYQGMIGVNYSLSNHSDIGVEYRYFRVQAIKFTEPSGTITTNFITHTAVIRFTYLFGAAT